MRLPEPFNNMFEVLRKYISPVFVAMLLISFTLWYIAKLSYTYTTEFMVDLRIDSKKFSVECVAEGKGTNLLRYKLYNSRRVTVSLDELQYRIHRHREAVEGQEGQSEIVERIHINHASLQNLLSVRFSDIKIISLGEIPDYIKD